MQIQLNIDKERLTKALKDFKTVSKDADLGKKRYLHSQRNDGIEIRAFPVGKDDPQEPPVSHVHIEVIIDSDKDWYDIGLEYGSTQNLRNGDSPVYEAIADTVENAVQEAGLGRIHLTGDHGTTFTGNTQ